MLRLGDDFWSLFPGIPRRAVIEALETAEDTAGPLSLAHVVELAEALAAARAVQSLGAPVRFALEGNMIERRVKTDPMVPQWEDRRGRPRPDWPVDHEEGE